MQDVKCVVIREDMEKTLSKEELKIILDNISECESIKVVGVTGGEPMLYPDLVEYIFDYDYGREISFTIKTNGSWGRNREKAKNFILKYKNRLKNISFSYDEFHQEYIDLQNILDIIEIADNLEVNTEIVGCFLKDGMKPGDILNLLGEAAFKTRFAWQPVIQTGSAAQMFKAEEFIRIFDTNKHEPKCIGLIDKTLLVNPKLDVYPCCSQVVENTILLIGNLQQKSLKEIIDDIRFNKVLYTVFTEGFRPFLNLLDIKGIEYKKDVTIPCELCEFLFRDDWFLKLLKEEGYFETI